MIQKTVKREWSSILIFIPWYTPSRALKLLMIPRIDARESIPPAYVAWRAGTTTLLLLGSLPP